MSELELASSHGQSVSQSTATALVDIPQEVKDALRKFRFKRRSEGSAAIVIKINKAKLVMEEVEQFDNISIEELAEGMCTLSPMECCLSYLMPQNCRRIRLATWFCRMN